MFSQYTSVSCFRVLFQLTIKCGRSSSQFAHMPVSPACQELGALLVKLNCTIALSQLVSDMFCCNSFFFMCSFYLVSEMVFKCQLCSFTLCNWCKAMSICCSHDLQATDHGRLSVVCISLLTSVLRQTFACVVTVYNVDSVYRFNTWINIPQFVCGLKPVNLYSSSRAIMRASLTIYFAFQCEVSVLIIPELTGQIKFP